MTPSECLISIIIDRALTGDHELCVSVGIMVHYLLDPVWIGPIKYNPNMELRNGL